MDNETLAILARLIGVGIIGVLVGRQYRKLKRRVDHHEAFLKEEAGYIPLPDDEDDGEKRLLAKLLDAGGNSEDGPKE